jgi:hypothetical protein
VTVRTTRTSNPTMMVQDQWTTMTTTGRGGDDTMKTRVVADPKDCKDMEGTG